MFTKISRLKKELMALALAATMAVTCIPSAMPIDTYAATKVKTPGALTVPTVNIESKAITLKWTPSKNAKSYQVAIRSQNKSWMYLKKVKKTDKNKKKYTKADLYKVVKGTGKNKKKYIVYKYRYTYKVIKSGLTSRSYTYNAPSYNKKYTLAVRGVNKSGKKTKYGPWYARNAVTWSKDTVRLPSGSVHTHKWVPTYEEKEGNKVETKTGVNVICGTCEDVIGFIPVSDTPSEDKVAAIADEHKTVMNCACESTSLADEIEISYEEGKKVLTGYTCSCSATKTLDGKVNEHVHSWDTRIKEKTENKTVKCARTYYVCLECAARGVETIYPTKYYDSSEAYHNNPDVYYDHVEFDDNGNHCQKYFSACPESSKHQEIEEDEYKTSARYKIIDEEFTINKPIVITYKETYCTVCGEVK